MPSPARNDRSAVAGPVALFLATSGAVAWGIYAAALAPELTLGGSPLAAILRLPGIVVGARGAPIALLALIALAFVLLAVAASARARLASVVGPAPAVWAGVVVVAAALAFLVSDPWWLLVFALGLAAAAVAPMRLASSTTAAVAAGVVGALVFAVLAALPLLVPGAPAWLGVFSRYPALLALPLGSMVARLPSTAERPAPVTRREKAATEAAEEAQPVA